MMSIIISDSSDSDMSFEADDSTTSFIDSDTDMSFEVESEDSTSETDAIDSDSTVILEDILEELDQENNAENHPQNNDEAVQIEDGDAAAVNDDNVVEVGAEVEVETADAENDRIGVDIRAEVGVSIVFQGSDLRNSTVTAPRGVLTETSANVPAGGILTSTGAGASGNASADKDKVFKSPTKSSSDLGDEEGNSCPICFEEWTTSGDHRLVSLKCGHLFGQSCINRWLAGVATKKCPQCNMKAKKVDVRIIYAKSLKVLDTSERDSALKDLEKEKLARRKAETEAAQTLLKYEQILEEHQKLQAQVKRNLKGVLPKLNNSPASLGDLIDSHKYIFEKALRISESGNCRVLTFAPQLGSLVISQPNTNPLFPGFGVRVLNFRDMKNVQFIFLHSKAIRDIAINPYAVNGLLLSASIDKTVKVTSLLTKAVVHTCQAPTPVWSVVWNTDNNDIFYAGLTNGTVLIFDLKKLNQPASSLNAGASSRAPVVSLQYVPKNDGSVFKAGGILVGQLDVISFYEITNNNEMKLHLLPLEGALTSLCFEVTSRTFLATFRPNAKYPTIRHIVSELISTENGCSSNIVKTIHGNNTMRNLSKTHLFTNPSDASKLMVCAGDESSVKTLVWEVRTSRLIERYEMGGEPVMDLKTFKINNDNYMATLSEKHLRLHKWA